MSAEAVINMKRYLAQKNGFDFDEETKRVKAKPRVYENRDMNEIASHVRDLAIYTMHQSDNMFDKKDINAYTDLIASVRAIGDAAAYDIDPQNAEMSAAMDQLVMANARRYQQAVKSVEKRDVDFAQAITDVTPDASLGLDGSDMVTRAELWAGSFAQGLAKSQAGRDKAPVDWQVDAAIEQRRLMQSVAGFKLEKMQNELDLQLECVPVPISIVDDPIGQSACTKKKYNEMRNGHFNARLLEMVNDADKRAADANKFVMNKLNTNDMEYFERPYYHYDKALNKFDPRVLNSLVYGRRKEIYEDLYFNVHLAIEGSFVRSGAHQMGFTRVSGGYDPHVDKRVYDSLGAGYAAYLVRKATEHGYDWNNPANCKPRDKVHMLYSLRQLSEMGVKSLMEDYFNSREGMLTPASKISVLADQITPVDRQKIKPIVDLSRGVVGPKSSVDTQTAMADPVGGVDYFAQAQALARSVEQIYMASPKWDEVEETSVEDYSVEDLEKLGLPVPPTRKRDDVAENIKPEKEKTRLHLPKFMSRGKGDDTQLE